jgi:hypothetical protein
MLFLVFDISQQFADSCYIRQVRSDRVIGSTDKSASPASGRLKPTKADQRRRIGSAAEARAWLESGGEAESAPGPTYAQVDEWLLRYRRRTRGLPYLQLVGDDLAAALEQGALEYVGIVFVPPRASVAAVFVIWGTLALEAGRLSLGEFAIAPFAPAQATLTSDALRRVRLSAILARAHAELASRAELAELAHRFRWADAPGGRERDTLTEIAARAAAGRPKRGRPGLGDAHYARIARAYLDKQAQGHGRGILNALAEQEGRPRETVRDWVAGARKRGFLTPGTQGRAGALPGSRLADFDQC